MDDWEQEYDENPEPVVKSESEFKRIEERKLVEESDNALTDSLFGLPEKAAYKPIIIPQPKIIKKRKPLPSPAPDKEKEKEKETKLRKQEAIRHEEIFGHGKLDEIEERYYTFEDKYR